MYVLIVAGASGSGKTTIVNLVAQQARDKGIKTLVVSMDQYYHSMVPGEPINWDDISAIDIDELVNDLKKLHNGLDIKIPQYDYVTHQRVPHAIDTGKPDLLILEGIFALYDQRIRDLANLTVYVDADPIKICLLRRIQRDTIERGRSSESVIIQYFDQVLPGYKKYVAPSKKYADLCYVNEGETPTEKTRFLQILNMCINLEKAQL